MSQSRVGSVIQDLQYAARLLRRSPGFAGVAILTLSLAIGANSALFSAIDAVLLRPLPYDRAGELYVVSSTYEGARREFTSFTDFSEWQAQSRAFTHMAAFRGTGVSITTPSGPEFLTGTAVSDGFFGLFGVPPQLGRTFSASDYRPGQGRVVILSHGLWRRHFAANPAAIGTSVVLDGELHMVIGVLPAGFAFPRDAELWRPLTLTASDANRRADLIRVIARLRRDVAPALAQAEVSAVARRLAERYPATNARWGIELVSLQTKSTEDVRRTLLALWGAVACVLLIACANIGIMLVSSGIRRAPELAVRAALGAGRGRVVRQLLTESALLGVLGGIGGIFVATGGLFAVRAVAPAGTRFDGVGLDPQVLIFTVALSLGTGLLVGIVPVWRIMRSDVQAALKWGGLSATPGRGQHRILRVLAVGQVTVSLVLLIGAGLMIRTLERLQAVPLGFSADRLLTFYVSLPEARYGEDAQMLAFFRQLLERVRALPGVRSASAVNALYIQWSDAFVIPVLVEGRPAPDQSRPPDTHVRIVDSEIHRVLQVPMVRGRSFTAGDGLVSRHAAVINEAMARRYFPGQDPIGQHISVLSSGPGQPIWEEVVGVAGDVRQKGLDVEVFPEVQIPYSRSPIGQMAIVVRTVADPAALAPSIRAQVQALDPNLPLTYVQTMDDVLATSVANRRAGMRLLSVFAGVALLLTAIGLYGVMAAAVSGRAREIAVRVALGGSPARVASMVVGQMLTVVTIGMAAGAVAAFAATRWLEPLLFGVARADAPTYGTTVAILVAVTLVSSYLPARRVARDDPATTLRSE